jgi:hypothetical protein
MAERGDSMTYLLNKTIIKPDYRRTTGPKRPSYDGNKLYTHHKEGDFKASTLLKQDSETRLTLETERSFVGFRIESLLVTWKKPEDNHLVFRVSHKEKILESPSEYKNAICTRELILKYHQLALTTTNTERT